MLENWRFTAFVSFLFLERIHVQCNQTGKIHKVKVTSLSREDLEPLGGNDYSKGSQPLLEYNKKSYRSQY